jgi:hypothetical protein
MTFKDQVMKIKLIETFLPPGVQAKMYARIGRCPRRLPTRQHNQIMRLWLVRNNCPENEIEKIDDRMEALAMAGHYAISTPLHAASWRCAISTAPAPEIDTR